MMLQLFDSTSTKPPETRALVPLSVAITITTTPRFYCSACGVKVQSCHGNTCVQSHKGNYVRRGVSRAHHSHDENSLCQSDPTATRRNLIKVPEDIQ